MPHGAVIYARVSTEEQTRNLSLTTQEAKCREYCERQGIDVDCVFIERGESAKSIARTELQRMMTYCRERKRHVQYVVVYSVNRLARDRFGHYAVRAFLHNLGIGLRSVTEPIDDTSTGKFMEGVLAAVAQFDNDVRAERTRAGMKTAVERGRWMFSPPLGFRKATDAVGRPTIEPDPDRAPLIGRAFELMATGIYSKQQVRDMVTAEGLRTVRGAVVSAQTFQKTLRNPLYAGMITVPKWGPDQWPGNFEAIVTTSVFTRVQAVLDGKALTAAPHRRNHPDFPLRRFVRCGSCNVPLTAAWSTGRRERYGYYRCRTRGCYAVNVTKTILENTFIEHLVRLTPCPEYVALFHEIVLDVWRERHAEAAEVRRRLDVHLIELRRRRDQLDHTFIFQRAIDKPTYDRQCEKLAEETVLAEIAVNDARIDELDIEGVLAFAEHLLMNVSRMWMRHR